MIGVVMKLLRGKAEWCVSNVPSGFRHRLEWLELFITNSLGTASVLRWSNIWLGACQELKFKTSQFANKYFVWIQQKKQRQNNFHNSQYIPHLM